MMPLEQYARLAALSLHLNDDPASACIRANTPLRDFEEAQRHWDAAVLASAHGEDTEVVEAFSSVFAQERNRLRTEAPTSASPRQVGVVLGIARVALSDGAELLPQAPIAGAPHILVAVQEFDPDATQPPVPNHGPALPFTGTTSPAKVRESMAQRPDEEHESAGETAFLPTPEHLRASLTGLRQSPMSLNEYARLRAEFTVLGEDNVEVLRRFGLTEATKKRHQQEFFERFSRDPDERARFQLLLADAIRLVREGL